MKITAIRCRALEGTMTCSEVFWEDRLCQPLDVYPEHRAIKGMAAAGANGQMKMRSVFVEIDTDAGITGLSGPFSEGLARIILSEFKGLLMGENPLATELLWDKMYRMAVHGRKGNSMMAISALDCAFWDIRGKWANAPVYLLLGGPTRDRIPAYASMLGFSVEPEQAAARAREYAAKGYHGQKWFFRASPAEGPSSIRRNVALAQAVREAIGDDDDMMLDCWMSWDLRYAKQMAPHLEPLHPRWIEEPALPDKYDICAQIRQAMPFPVSNGEHEYTRWGFRRLLEIGAQDVLQPDIYWAGGVTETLKIAALASAYDIEVIPHGHSSHVNAHFLMAQPPSLCPYAEYLIKWNTVHQFFLKEKLEPIDGFIRPTDAPGFGLALDEDLIENETILE